MSRGYDGPEIDDFRDSGWERERSSPHHNSSRGSGTDWQTRETAKLRLQRVREAESSSDHAIARNREHRCLVLCTLPPAPPILNPLAACFSL